jgi:hypothetical protein
MTISQIRCADDLAALAAEALQQVRKDKQYRDLISAVLMANHVGDWHFQKDLGRKFGMSERAEMMEKYPEWDVLRQLANGAKHCQLQAQQNSLKWEHYDFWGSPGHVGNNGLDWFVEFGGKDRSVTILIESFLEKFANRAFRPT